MKPHSLLLRASTNEDASREAGDEITGSAETRGQKVPGTVFHTVFLHNAQKTYRVRGENRLMCISTECLDEHVLRVDSGLKAPAVAHVAH